MKQKDIIDTLHGVETQCDALALRHDLGSLVSRSIERDVKTGETTIGYVYWRGRVTLRDGVLTVEKANAV